VGRSQDILFGGTLRVCFPEALIGTPAIAVFHDPPELREYVDGGPLVPGLQAADLVGLLERDHAFPAWARTPAERLGSLGSALAQLGSLPPREFLDAAAPLILSARAAQACAGESFLQRYRRTPAYWARRVDRYLEELQRHVEEAPVIPDDVPGRDPQERLRAFQTELRLYGALLEAWPRIWEAALELNAAGAWGGVDIG
jgi:hypothetical protein